MFNKIPIANVKSHSGPKSRVDWQNIADEVALATAEGNACQVPISPEYDPDIFIRQLRLQLEGRLKCRVGITKETNKLFNVWAKLHLPIRENAGI